MLDEKAQAKAATRGKIPDLNEGDTMKSAPENAITSAGICTLDIFSLRIMRARMVIINGESLIMVETSACSACPDA